ncbi:GFA family protein [Zooshikella marina]|uniref:GFA family protein n=1 Tax=Zooshikella ganghwensis TaxID=202772 RepID=UPI001BB04060|nr:GFA family protein [Zooshikella ganghwensis]MBU2706617.1 GFA family protein [Zooshikella ganghwensis]
MSDKYSGSCLCGEITFEINGGFESFYLCHCSRCRKDTGSAHASNLFSTSAKLKWLSGEEKVKSFNLSGTKHAKSFCTICGSAVPSIQMDGKLLVVPAGSLDTALDMEASAHILIQDRAQWDNELEKAPMVEGLPN